MNIDKDKVLKALTSSIRLSPWKWSPVETEIDDSSIVLRTSLCDADIHVKVVLYANVYRSDEVEIKVPAEDIVGTNCSCYRFIRIECPDHLKEEICKLQRNLADVITAPAWQSLAKALEVE